MGLWANTESDTIINGAIVADTIYFGGGTPSLLPPQWISKLVDACIRCFQIDPCPEITVEMNPATSSREEMTELIRVGVNRVSLGIQSLHDSELQLMGRRHNTEQALRTLHDLREAGFQNVSVDLIAGFPGQSRESVRESTERVLALRPDHLSVYLLELKEGTELETLVRRGTIAPVDDDLAADMYEDVCILANAAGYEQYEISNYALEGRSCRHNLKYWTDAPYLGVGPGAHGMTGRHRYANFSDLAQYQSALNSGRLPLEWTSELTPLTRFTDALIMGLRLTNGLDLRGLSHRYQVDASRFVHETIGELEPAGLFSLADNVLILTARGRLLSNIIFSRWV
jgi:oxygen-independent coproporphyrinogen-3 oxidase